MKPKRLIRTLSGFRNDFNNNEMFKSTKFQINYTSDNHGKTLSIGDLETNIQFSIPFNDIYKEITNVN